MRTTVGYTGGEKPYPTYRSMGDHTESVRIEYDPSRVSYSDLLRLFWSAHNPGRQAWSRQYENAVFYHTEEQRRLVFESRRRIEMETGRTVKTRIDEAGTFYPAEDYHQKYYLRHSSALLKELRIYYPSEPALAASTAAARINGYLAGYGTRHDLLRNLDRLGLSAAGREELLASASRLGE